MPNVNLEPYQRPSMWRRMSLATWGESNDPQAYARAEIDMSKAMVYAKELSEREGVKVTPVHLVVRAIALALRAQPTVNALVRLGRSYQRRDVDVFCQIAIPGEKPDLSGAVIRQADTKPAQVIARELAEKAAAARAGTDHETAQARRRLDVMPGFLFRFVLWLIGLLQYTFNLDLSRLGIPRDAFGSALVTSIGPLGLSEALAPLVPMTRTPIVLSVGKIEDRAVVRDGEIVIRPIAILGATFDHRILDGYQGGKLAKTALAYLDDPAAYEASLDDEAA